MFTDNCVGRKNMPHFFQFILWSQVCIAIGSALVLGNIYTRNITHQRGAQGILDAEVPHFVYAKYLFGFVDSFEGSLAMIDGTILFIVFGLSSMVGAPGVMTFYNIKQRTSEVLKRKRRSGQSIERVAAMSFAQTMTFIYGADWTWKKVLFAVW